MYEDLSRDQDDSYEPPPSHRVFNTASSASLPRGEYLDSCRNRPDRPPRKPLRPGKASRQLPPEPTHVGSDEEDYISPDGSNDDDNYIEPSENPPSNPMMHGGHRAGRDRPMLPTPLPERPPSPGEIIASSSKQTVSNPHTTITFFTTKTQPQVPVINLQRDLLDLYLNLCLESRTLPLIQTEQKPPPRAFTLDLKRPKIPLPHFTSPRQTDRGSVSNENGSTDQDKDADVYKKPWYASACDRKTADDVLVRSNKDGAFLVRKSSGQDVHQPYTLVVFYKGRVYNIPIRFIQTTQQYALGREKKGEEYFSSVSHIIENHQRNPLVLIDSQSNTKDAAKLCYPVKP
eukprot:superscaffoldBa00000234_g2993